MKKKNLYNLLTLTLISTPIYSSANTYENKAKEMERIMVIGDSSKIPEIAGSAHILSKEEIEKFNYNDVNRVLRQIPGLNLQEEEGYGNRPNIGLRGGRSERSADITLMEDGILIAPAPYAASSAYYFPRINRMEAVEVRKGSSAIKFGPRTTNGAVNLISRSIPQEREGSIMLGYGTDDAERVEFNYGDKHGRYSYVFDINHEATEGFKTINIVGGDTGYSIQDFMGKFKIESDARQENYQYVEFKVGATTEDSDETYLGLTQTDFNIDPYQRYAASQKDNMDANHQQISIKHYIEPTENLDITTNIYRNDFSRNWYKLQSVTVGGSQSGISSALDSTSHLNALKGLTDLAGDANNNLTLRANNRDYYSQGIQSNIAHQFESEKAQHDLEFGLRYHYDEEDRVQHEDRYSITSGVMNQTSAGTAGSNANRVGSANAIALFIEDEIKFSDFSIIPGLRYENIRLKRKNRANGQTDKNDLDVFVPGLGFIYNLSDQLNLFLSAHKGFAPPSPSSDTSQDPEESYNYEIGARFEKDKLNIEFIPFLTKYENLLGEETLSSGGGTGTGEQFNGGEVDVYGLEFGAKYDLASNNSKYKFPVNLNYTYTKAEFQSSFSSAFDEWGNVEKGDKLPYIPTHQLFASLGIEADKWQFTAAAKFIDEMRTTAGSGPIQSGTGTDEQFIVDLNAKYNIAKNTEIFLDLLNIFDEKYVAARRPAGARPGAPTSFLTGIKYKF